MTPSTRPIDAPLIDERGVTALDGTTKARIERAALNLFVDHGVDAATTREIAAAAGISEGALYRHFRSKDEIAETIFFAIHQRLATLVWQAGARATGIADQTGAIVDAYCQTADDDWALFSFHLLSAHRFLPRAGTGDRKEAAGENPVAAIEDIIQDAIDRDEIAPADSALAGGMALGIVMQTALQIIYGRLPGPMRQYGPALQAAALAILQPTA